MVQSWRCPHCSTSNNFENGTVRHVCCNCSKHLQITEKSRAAAKAWFCLHHGLKCENLQTLRDQFKPYQDSLERQEQEWQRQDRNRQKFQDEYRECLQRKGNLEQQLWAVTSQMHTARHNQLFSGKLCTDLKSDMEQGRLEKFYFCRRKKEATKIFQTEHQQYLHDLNEDVSNQIRKMNRAVQQSERELAQKEREQRERQDKVQRQRQKQLHERMEQQQEREQRKWSCRQCLFIGRDYNQLQIHKSNLHPIVPLYRESELDSAYSDSESAPALNWTQRIEKQERQSQPREATDEETQRLQRKHTAPVLDIDYSDSEAEEEEEEEEIEKQERESQPRGDTDEETQRLQRKHSAPVPDIDYSDSEAEEEQEEEEIEKQERESQPRGDTEEEAMNEEQKAMQEKERESETESEEKKEDIVLPNKAVDSEKLYSPPWNRRERRGIVFRAIKKGDQSVCVLFTKSGFGRLAHIPFHEICHNKPRQSTCPHALSDKTTLVYELEVMDGIRFTKKEKTPRGHYIGCNLHVFPDMDQVPYNVDCTINCEICDTC